MLYLSMEKQEFHSIKKTIVALQEKYFFINPNRLAGKEFNKTDCIIIYSLTNLGTNLTSINKTLECLSAYSPTLKILSMNLEFDSKLFPYLMSIVQELSAMEEHKKQVLLRKQKNGIQKAKKLGKSIGRPPMPYPENWNELYDAWVHKTMKVNDILSHTSLTKSSFYHLVHRYQKTL